MNFTLCYRHLFICNYGRHLCNSFKNHSNYYRGILRVLPMGNTDEQVSSSNISPQCIIITSYNFESINSQFFSPLKCFSGLLFLRFSLFLPFFVFGLFRYEWLVQTCPNTFKLNSMRRGYVCGVSGSTCGWAKVCAGVHVCECLCMVVWVCVGVLWYRGGALVLWVWVALCDEPRLINVIHHHIWCCISKCHKFCVQYESIEKSLILLKPWI